MSISRQCLTFFPLRIFQVVSFLSLLAVGLPLPAQEAPRLEASVSASEVNVRESLELTFTLFNAKNGQFQAPDLSDFEILEGPYTRISAGLQEGKAQTSKNYVFVLRPLSVGQLRIGSATVVMDSLQLQTSPIRISAVERDIQTRGTAFAETRFSKAEVYNGQPFWMDVVVFYADSNWTVQAASAPEIPGFMMERCAEPVKGSARIDGKTWFSSTERIRMLPQQSGQLTIPAFPFNIMEWRRDVYSSFGHSVKREVVVSHPEKIVVRALPPDAPSDFSGAVGFWKMKADWIQTESQTGKNLLLQLTLEGEGDLKRIQAPKLMLPPALTAFPSKTREIQQRNPCLSISSSKIFEYALAAEHEGRFKAEVKFVFFNPDSGKFEWLHTTTPEVEVKAVTNSMESPQYSKPSPFPAIAKILLLALSASALFFFGWRRWRSRKANPSDVPELAPLLTPKQRLWPAGVALEQNDEEAFFKVLSEILLQALGEKRGMDFTRADALNLQKNNAPVDPATAKLLMMLEAADSMRYSGGVSAQKKPQEWYELAKEALGELDEDKAGAPSE